MKKLSNGTLHVTKKDFERIDKDRDMYGYFDGRGYVLVPPTEKDEKSLGTSGVKYLGKLTEAWYHPKGNKLIIEDKNGAHREYYTFKMCGCR